MKKTNIVPNEQSNKTWRFRWWHVLICSILIAAIFVSMSVGMGYARYAVETTPLKQSYTVKGDLFIYPTFVVAKRVPGQDTVLTSKDGNLKVTVPATATGPEIDNAEYYLLYFTMISNVRNRYDYDNKQNRVAYTLTLRSMSFVNAQGQLPRVIDSNNSIEVELRVGHDAVDFKAISPSTTAASRVYDEENGVLRFTGLDQIWGRTNSAPAHTIATNTYAADFDMASVTPDTSWYDDSYDSFVINTPAQLAGVSKLVNDGTADFAGKTIKLGDDISLYNEDGSKYTWEPIGNYSNSFKGNFDGDGHTISGLNLRSYDDSTAAKDRTCGLFGMAVGEGAVTSISNVTLKDVSYAANLGVYTDPDSGQAFGALVGRSNNCNISDVHVDGLAANGHSKYIGGILGRGDSEGSIKDCSVVNAVFDNDDANNVGGIVGIHYGNGQDVNISNCYVSAQMNGSYSSAGGIVGFGNNDSMGVKNSYFTGSFAPTTSGAKYGGILGIGFSGVDKNYTINNCYADCDADLIGHGYFGYKVLDGTRAIEQELSLYGNNLVVGNSSWSGSNNTFTWYSYAYDAGYSDYYGTGEKSSACWFSAGMSYDDFLAAIANGGTLPALSAARRTTPTTAPTTAPTAAPTTAPQATQAPATTAPAPAATATEAPAESQGEAE